MTSPLPIVSIHGYGGFSRDALQMAQTVSRQQQGIAYMTPQSPQICETGRGYQWYPVREFFPEGRSTPEGEQKRLRAILEHSERLNTAIDQWLEKLGSSPQDLIFMGFSQGGMLALHAALQRTETCKAVFCFSGDLILPDQYESYSNSNPRVYFFHGENDAVIPVKDAINSDRALKRAGLTSSLLIEENGKHVPSAQRLEQAARVFQYLPGNAARPHPHPAM